MVQSSRYILRARRWPEFSPDEDPTRTSNSRLLGRVSHTPELRAQKRARNSVSYAYFVAGLSQNDLIVSCKQGANPEGVAVTNDGSKVQPLLLAVETRVCELSGSEHVGAGQRAEGLAHVAGTLRFATTV